MGTIWIPPESEVARDTALLESQLYDVTGRLSYWNKELQAYDEHLRVVMAKPGANIEDGLKPGYYHLIRIRPGSMAYVKPIEYDDGAWRDLDSSVWDILMEDDLWNDRTQKMRRRRRERIEEARERQRAREAQDRIDEFNERAHSMTSTSILVPRSV